MVMFQVIVFFFFKLTWEHRIVILAPGVDSDTVGVIKVIRSEFHSLSLISLALAFSVFLSSLPLSATQINRLNDFKNFQELFLYKIFLKFSNINFDPYHVLALFSLRFIKMSKIRKSNGTFILV